MAEKNIQLVLSARGKLLILTTYDHGMAHGVDVNTVKDGISLSWYATGRGTFYCM